MQIAVVGPADLPELLPLMRAYCDFYQIAPEDQALLELSQALLPEAAAMEGMGENRPEDARRTRRLAG